MDKKNLVSLISAYAQKDDIAFRKEVHSIAQELDRAGDYELASYIDSIISGVGLLSPMPVEPFDINCFDEIKKSNDSQLYHIL